MGVNLKDLVIKHPLALTDLAHKIIVIDGHNMLYQFLSTIRSRDGQLLTDSNGNVTSHLIGLFSRLTKFMNNHIKLVFVFDGEIPKLKHKELQKRKALKLEAEKKYQEALASEDVASMQKYAARTSRLTSFMIDDAKKLITLLGIPIVQAPAEGEAQAARIVSRGDAWAVVSQDYDSLLYGTPRLIHNLSIEGKRKLPGKLAYTTIHPQLIDLAETLRDLKLNREQLIVLSMLVGTDYAPSGAKGIGPKKGLDLVRTKTPEEIFANFPLDVDWREVYYLFTHMPVTSDYTLHWKPVDQQGIIDFLVNQRDFTLERVENTLASLQPAKQRGLGDFL